MMGSFSLLQFVRMESKYVLHADSTTRCAFSVCPSHANVTSQKQPRSRSCENIVCKLLWWYFHLKQYCCGNMVGLKVEAVIKRRWKKREMKTGGEGIMTNNYEILFSVHAWRKALWQIKGPGVLVQQLGRLKFMLFFFPPTTPSSLLSFQINFSRFLNFCNWEASCRNSALWWSDFSERIRSRQSEASMRCWGCFAASQILPIY